MTGVLYGVGGGGEGKDHLSVYERVNSLFEANYEEAHGCSQAGRTTWAGVSVLVP
jgi:outer membrane cobalamin receptor